MSLPIIFNEKLYHILEHCPIFHLVLMTRISSFDYTTCIVLCSHNTVCAFGRIPCICRHGQCVRLEWVLMSL